MKSYTVRNEAGDTFEVDEDKIGDAEKDGFLPIVSNGKDEHRVSFSDLAKAKADGFSPLVSQPEKSFFQKTGDFIDAASENMTDMLPGKGLITKAATLPAAGVEYLYDKATGNGRDFGEVYDENLKENLDYQDKRRNASKAGAIVGAGMGLVTGMKVPGFGKNPVTRTLGNAAIGAVDAGTRGQELLDTDQAAKAGAATAAISGALETIPLVGKGAKAVARLLPGTENALPIVNKYTAKLGQLVPGTDINADQLEDLLSNPEARRAARNLKGEQLDEIGENAAKVFKQLDKTTDAQIGVAYAKGQQDFLSAIDASDAAKFNFEDMDRIKGVIEKRPELFGRAKKVIGQVDDIMRIGGASEIGAATEDMTLPLLVKNFGEESGAKVQASRLLEARRYLDDVTKNVDYDKMLDLEKNMIVRARQSINKQIEGLNGGKALRDVDAVFAEYAPAKKNAFFKLETPLPSGGREITPDTALQFLKSDRAQARFIEDKLGELNTVMQKLEGMDAKEVDRAIREVVKISRDGFKTLRSLEDLKRASGGPSSQAINTAAQMIGGYYSGGLSLLAMPITNPAGWMKLVDSVEPAMRPFLGKLSEASRKFVETNPALASRIYLVSKSEVE